MSEKWQNMEQVTKKIYCFSSAFPVWSRILSAFSHFFLVVNSSINILFYCVFNSQFRVEARKAISELCEKMQKPSSTTTTNMTTNMENLPGNRAKKPQTDQEVSLGQSKSQWRNIVLIKTVAKKPLHGNNLNWAKENDVVPVLSMKDWWAHSISLLHCKRLENYVTGS